MLTQQGIYLTKLSAAAILLDRNHPFNGVKGDSYSECEARQDRLDVAFANSNKSPERIRRKAYKM